METSLRTLRIVRLVMLASIALFSVIAYSVRLAPGQPEPAVLLAIGAVAIADVGVILFFQKKVIARQSALLAKMPNDRTALGRWYAGHVAVFAICEAIALFGFVLRYLGFAFVQVAPFLLAGFGLMFFFGPKPPSSAIG